MFHILFKYLILKKQLHIPGIGQFIIVQLPSRLNYTSNVIHAPVSIVQFNNTNASADKSFFDFITTELQTGKGEAIRQFHDFSFKLSNLVNTQNSLQLPGMGIISKDSNNTLSFEPVPMIQNYFPDVSLESFAPAENAERLRIPQGPTAISIKSANEHPRKKYRWWIAAIILGIIGVAAIAYYYISKNQLF